MEQSPCQSPGWPLAGEALPDSGLGSCTEPGSNPGSASYQLRDPDESLKGAKPLLPTLEREGDNSTCLLGCGLDAVRGHQQWRAQGRPPVGAACLGSGTCLFTRGNFKTVKLAKVLVHFFFFVFLSPCTSNLTSPQAASSEQAALKTLAEMPPR